MNMEYVISIFDGIRQISRISVPLCTEKRFVVDNAAEYIAPLIRVSGDGMALLDDIRIRPADNSHEAKRGYLLVTNYYPSKLNPYANMFVHHRVKAYLEAGLPVEVFVVKRQPSGQTTEYYYDGVHVFVGSKEDLRAAIQRGLPDKILTHFVSPEMIWAWEGTDIPVIVWMHGSDVYPPCRRLYNYHNYDEAACAVVKDLSRVTTFSKVFKTEGRYTFVAVSDLLRRDIERDYGVSMETCHVIHNYIDTETFRYIPKTADMRRNVVSIKSYRTPVYAGSLMADAIKVLSKRTCFDNMRFSLFGDGPLFYESLGGLVGFSNVRIIKRFMETRELCFLYNTHGVVLIPTRHDTHGVSRDEAMACGLVPVTSMVGAVPEFVDSSCGILAHSEDPVSLADGLEFLYGHPEEYIKMSEAAAARVRNQCRFENTIQKEITLILA